MSLSLPKIIRSRPRSARRRLVLNAKGRVSVLASATATCVLAVAGTATAGTPTGQGHHHTKNKAPLTGTAKAEAESAKALKQAEQTGQSVPVNALTTPTSTTVADPEGTFTLSQSIEPVRAWKDRAWKDLDATLHLNADHTVSPNLTSTGLVLSDGGNGPLATMTATGHTLSLSDTSTHNSRTASSGR